MRKLLKGSVVGLGAVVLATLGLQASDALLGVENGMSGLLATSDSVCGPGAVLLQFKGRSLCVDQYEASPSAECQYSEPGNVLQTGDNLKNPSCAAASKPEVVPWRFVSSPESQQLCARAGKRLPTAEEWYHIALTLSDYSGCVMNTNDAQKTGTAACTSSLGVSDIVGNVWEWVDESITDGQYEGMTLPSTGYVSLVDNNGVVIETSDQSDASYGDDYAITNNKGVFGMLRGGFYAGGSDTGLYAQNMAAPFDLRTAGVGFRCVRDL